MQAPIPRCNRSCTGFSGQVNKLLNNTRGRRLLTVAQFGIAMVFAGCASREMIVEPSSVPIDNSEKSREQLLDQFSGWNTKDSENRLPTNDRRSVFEKKSAYKRKTFRFVNSDFKTKDYKTKAYRGADKPYKKTSFATNSAPESGERSWFGRKSSRWGGRTYETDSARESDNIFNTDTYQVERNRDSAEERSRYSGRGFRTEIIASPRVPEKSKTPGVVRRIVGLPKDISKASVGQVRAILTK